ncbi:MAG: sensor histidine kinase [Clostridia bacterium]|nr:sensor histidine kinase [Clostridia bacterium]
MLSFFFIVLLPFIAFGIYAYLKSEAVLEKHAASLALQNTTQLSIRIDQQLYDMESILKQITSNKELVDCIIDLPKYGTENGPLATYEKLYFYGDTLENILTLKHDNLSGIYYIYKDRIYDIYVQDRPYTPSLTAYNKNVLNPIGMKLDFKILYENWYSATLKNYIKTNIIGTNTRFYNEGGSKNVISASKLVRGVLTKKSFGVLLIDYNYSALLNIVDKHSYFNPPSYDLYVVDSNNSIMYSKNKKLLNTKLDYDFVKDLPPSESGDFTVIRNGKKMHMIYYTSPYSSWKTICFIPPQEFLKDIFVIKAYVIVLTLICLLAVLIFSFVASSILLKPINKLVGAMAEVEKGDLSTRIDVKSNDETKFLADSFNNMTSNIENLITKVYTAQLKQKEAELSALQRQINPHFLYNTLESIRGVSLFYGLHNIASMSKSLSMLFRYSISDTVSVTVRDEIKHLENYLAIQNFRHEDKFQVVYNIADELYEYRILKFTLQPLIENAIKHGLEVKMGKGTIQIDVFIVESTLVIKISDDGIGMPEQKVDELNNVLIKNVTVPTGHEDDNNESGTGIGVLNVNARIKLYFGSYYGLKYLKPDIGTAVEIVLPAIEKEE